MTSESYELITRGYLNGSLYGKNAEIFTDHPDDMSNILRNPNLVKDIANMGYLFDVTHGSARLTRSGVKDIKELSGDMDTINVLVSRLAK